MSLKNITLFLYLLLTVVLAMATFVEHAKGTAFVTEHIYHSIPFVVLWSVLGVLMVATMVRRKMWSVWPSFLLHISFGVILMGALTSFLTSKKGVMHLRMGEPTFQYIESETRIVRDLPFTLALDTFYVDYYPGTEAPADYVSIVSVSTKKKSSSQRLNPSTNQSINELPSQRISMNRVLDHEGFRFYQSSYDEDGRGSWLSVNYDPWGTGVTYAGYLLLFVSMVGLMVHPRGEFRKLLRKMIRMRSRSLVCFMLLGAFAHGGWASETKKLSIVPLAEAESMKTMQVIYHDRVVPLNTLARDFVKKLYGKDSFSDLTPEQILLSWQRYPQEWAYVPAIRIKNDELRAKLGIKGGYARMVDFYEYDKLTTYKLTWIMRELSSLMSQVEGASTNHKPSPLQKAIVEADEKVALVLMLQNGTLVRPLPSDGSVEPLTPARVQAELLYNSIPFTKVLFMFNLMVGIVLLLLHWVPSQLPPKGMRLALLFSFLFALSGYLLRWYIGGRIPLSNGYETMLFLALSILLLALVLSRRFQPAIAFGFLLSGFTLLVAHLGQMNPQITPLMPVLVSPWLSLHVSVIMMSYALFAFILLNGVWALCVPRQSERLMLYSRLMLYPAVFLLAAGIFIGAVWANVSWGRYWGWDPKEVWALITLLIYALPLHGGSLSAFRRPQFFHAYLVVAFLSVLVTYFGVNLFLGGMHSYA